MFRILKKDVIQFPQMSEKVHSGSAIAKLRTDLKLTMSAVAERSKGGDDGESLTQGYISEIESGNRPVKNITIKKFLALARGLNVSPTLLFAIALDVEEKDSKLLRQIFEYAKSLPLQRQKDVLDFVEMHVEKLAAQPKEEENFVIVEVGEEVQSATALNKRKKLVNGQK